MNLFITLTNTNTNPADPDLLFNGLSIASAATVNAIIPAVDALGFIAIASYGKITVTGVTAAKVGGGTALPSGLTMGDSARVVK